MASKYGKKRWSQSYYRADGKSEQRLLPKNMFGSDTISKQKGGNLWQLFTSKVLFIRTMIIFLNWSVFVSFNLLLHQRPYKNRLAFSFTRISILNLHLDSNAFEVMYCLLLATIGTLTLYQTTEFQTSPIWKTLHMSMTKWMWLKIWMFLERTENIVGKGENPGYQHFLLFLQCFQKGSFLGSLKVDIVR